MLPADLDTRIVWSAFVISRSYADQSLTALLSEARLRRMPMTRADALNILRRYVDRFDNDVRQTRKRAS